MDKIHSKNILKKIENNIYLKILTCIILSSIIIILFHVINKEIDNRNKQYSLVEDIKLINAVEKMYIDKNYLKFEGYAFYLGQDSRNASISLFLKNLNKDEEIWADTKVLYRPDIQNYYNCDYNYEKSGFIAKINLNNINMEDGYEIIINIDIKNRNNEKIRKTVSTGQFFYNKKLLSYNPFNFNYPESNLQSELLRKVFEEGQLHIYIKDKGLYVYEYQNKLYWITTNDFNFNEDGKTIILYQLWTSQPNLLPHHRIKNGFDNLDFVFEDNELKTEITEQYRVAVCDIPNQYSITYIKTGVYYKNNKEQSWNVLFQLKHLK